MEVIDHQKAAAEQIFAQEFCMIVGEVPMADFDSVNPGPVEDLVGVVDQVDHLFGGSGVDAGQAADAFEKLPVGFGEIGGPTASLAAVTGVAARGIAQAREGPLGLFVGVAGDCRRIVLFVRCIP